MSGKNEYVLKYYSRIYVSAISYQLFLFFREKKDLSTAILEKKSKPNRLIVEDAISDDNSVAVLSTVTTIISYLHTEYITLEAFVERFLLYLCFLNFLCIILQKLKWCDFANCASTLKTSSIYGYST